FLARVRDDKAGEAERIAAATQLIDLRHSDADAPEQVLELITPRTSPELAQGLLEAVGHSDSPAARDALVALLPALTPGGRAAGVRVLLGRADWTEALLDALQKGKVHITDLSLDQRQSLMSHPR